MIERINLLPSQKRARATGGPEIGWFVLALGLVAASLMLLGGREILKRGSLAQRRSEIVRERDLLTAELQTAAAAVGRIQALAAEEAALQARLDALASLQQGRRSWSELLVRISRLTPEGLWLTAVETIVPDAGAPTPLALRFQGKALSHQRISELLGNLERDQEFQEVALISTATGTYLDREIVDFNLSCQVRAR